jgi:hypothetical protein
MIGTPNVSSLVGLVLIVLVACISA